MSITSTISDSYNLIKSRIWPFLAPIFSSVSAQSIATLASIALDAVTAVEANPALVHATPTAKRDFVAAELKKNPFVTGNQFADYIINLAIEIAVSKFKTTSK